MGIHQFDRQRKIRNSFFPPIVATRAAFRLFKNYILPTIVIEEKVSKRYLRLLPVSPKIVSADNALLCSLALIIVVHSIYFVELSS